MEARSITRIGSHCTVLIDEIREGEAWCRTEGDAPEIDGVVIVAGVAGRPGDFIDVEIEDARGPVLFGKRID